MSEQDMEQAITNAVQRGIREAVTPELAEAFWAAGLNMLQKQATAHAGRFVIGSIFGLMKRVSIFIIIGLLVYSVGGWSALANFFKILFFQGTP